MYGIDSATEQLDEIKGLTEKELERITMQALCDLLFRNPNLRVPFCHCNIFYCYSCVKKISTLFNLQILILLNWLFLSLRNFSGLFMMLRRIPQYIEKKLLLKYLNENILRFCRRLREPRLSEEAAEKRTCFT